MQPYRAESLKILSKIYQDAIHHLGHLHYSAAQIRAWSGFADDSVVFGKWLENNQTIVALQNTNMVGFGGMEGITPVRRCISSLFVAPNAMRQGIASTLLAQLMKESQDMGVKILTAKASEFSRRLFEQSGFCTIAIENIHRQGISFTRYAMRADISGGSES